MKTSITIGQLLRWRLARAEAEAPRAPRGVYLLELARPWWKLWPERVQALVNHVGRMQVAYGHAMAEPAHARTEPCVPVLVVAAVAEWETSARVLYFNVREDRLRLRFQLDSVPGPPPESFEVTFVFDQTEQPLFSAPAVLAVDNEYRVDVQLPPDLAGQWERLRVTDRMPFRFILHTDTEGG
jgi:hypothetical protein